ncbi:hypothetical protein D6C79_07710 [Aureobasidium pullulans]|nr:hypothetical protein D6C79_07710 [Aureobasidium pullulans]
MAPYPDAYPSRVIQQFPFLKYASFWVEHTKAAKGPEKSLQTLVAQLYRNKDTFLSALKSCRHEYREHHAYPSGYIRSKSLIISEGKHPLNHACFWGLKFAVDSLLKDGAEIDTSDPNHDSPLHAASYNGHDSIVTELLEKGALINGFAGQPSWVPLVGASSCGHISTVQVLLQHRADVYVRDLRQETALKVAASRGDLRLVRLLLQHGSPVDSTYKLEFLNEALQAASSASQSTIVHLLLHHGARDTDHRALHLAARVGNAEVARLLLYKQTTWLSPCLGRAMFGALSCGSVPIVEMLIERGADPNGCHGDPNPLLTATQYAEESGDDAVVRLLRNKGAVPQPVARPVQAPSLPRFELNPGLDLGRELSRGVPKIHNYGAQKRSSPDAQKTRKWR